MIRTSLGEPAAEPTETEGRPRVRIRPATVRAASLSLKRFAARSRRLAGDSETSGAGRRPTFAPAAAGSTHPSRPARSRQRSQTSFGPSFGLMKVLVRSPASIVRWQTAHSWASPLTPPKLAAATGS